MLRSIWFKMLHDQWRMLAIWTVLAGLLAGFYLSLYPSIGAVEEMRSLLEAMPPELRAMFSAESVDLSTPAGYLNIEQFTFVMPLVVMAITLTGGAGATTGEEERGTLELLLANPVRRWRVVVEKAYVAYQERLSDYKPKIQWLADDRASIGFTIMSQSISAAVGGENRF